MLILHRFSGYHLDGIIKSTCESISGSERPAFNNPAPVCQRQYKYSFMNLCFWDLTLTIKNIKYALNQYVVKSDLVKLNVEYLNF